MANETTPGPLAGTRVLDLTNERAELAGRHLADLGADVLKIEPPEGSPSRRIPPFVAGHEGDPEHSLYWASVALGKKSAVLDIKTAAGADAVKRLAASADIFIESDDPGVFASYGLGYDAIKAINPAIVYVSVTPFGQTGPRANWPATELTVEAASGMVSLQGDNDRPPLPIGYPQSAFHGGAQAATDAVIALLERRSSGLGQHLDVSMQTAMMWTLMNATGFPKNHGTNPPRFGDDRKDPPLEIAPGVTFPPIWKCKDGWTQATLTLGGLGAQTLAETILAAEAEGGLAPERQGTGWSKWVLEIKPEGMPTEIMAAAKEEIGKFFLRHTRDEIMRIAVQRRMLVAPVRTIDNVVSNEHFAARDFWTEVDGVKHPGVVPKLSRTPLSIQRRAPRLGEHQSEVESAPAAKAAAKGSRTKKRALEGLKVADFAWVGVGPLVSKALADHGATVVHIESATRPDALRLAPPFKNAIAHPDNSQFFANFNSSKLGLGLNLGMDQGREIARKLIDWADVVVESFVPGVLRGMGLGYEEVSKTNPGLVMVSTCLCGQTGPEAPFRGFGTQGAALAGILGITAWPDPDRAPAGTWGAYTDFIAPRFGIAALGAALLERDRSGLGQHIDLAQVETGVRFIEPLILDYTVNGRVAGPSGHNSDRACPHGVYPVAGTERYIAIACETDDHWKRFANLAGLTSVCPADATLAQRMQNIPALTAAITAWTKSQDPWACADKLIAAGVPASVVQRPMDLYEDPQIAHRGFFVTCDHAMMGETPYDGPVTIFSETPPKLTAAPIVGQHTNEVLSDILKLSEDEIMDLVIADVLT